MSKAMNKTPPLIILAFLVGFEAGNVLVDLDNGTSTGTPDNAVDINDLLFFLSRFEAGC